MAIKVELNPFFLEDAEGRTSFEMDCLTVGMPQGAGQALPSPQGEIFDRREELQSCVEIYVNGESTHPEGLSFPLKDGDEVSATVIAAGG